MTMTKSFKRALERSARAMGSNRFFWIIVVLFALESAWIALTARYPQAFDEQFHLGLIKLHAQQLLPFFNQQPDGANVYGAISRDPSYLYHYLLSVPYRFVSLFTHNTTTLVIWLRFINIALLAGSLVVFRRIFVRAKASPAASNVCLLFFVLTPVVPLLASQINYDNLVILLVGLSVLWCMKWLEQVRIQQQLRWDTLAELTLFCLVGSLVKYAFLPIFVVIVAFVIFEIWKQRKTLKLERPRKTLSKLQLICYGLLLLISLGLFVERYGVNVVRYHTPTPECDQVLSISECQEYPPWARNYNNVQHKTQLRPLQVVTYPAVWVKHSIVELVFTIGSGFNKSGTVDYYTGTQLPVMEGLAWVVFSTGGLLVLVYICRFWQDWRARLLLACTALYVLALLGQNYMDYVHIGQLVAIHGRYLLPVLPFIYFVLVRAFGSGVAQLRSKRLSTIKAGLVVVALLACTQGGGITTYIVRSQPWWFWPGSPAAQHVNAGAQKILKPLIIGI